jgi:hypothetical protein
MPSKTFKRKNANSKNKKSLKRNSKRKYRTKKMRSNIRKMKGGSGNNLEIRDIKISENIYISILNLFECDKEEYDKFIAQYEKDKDKLCIHKNKRTQNIYTHISNDSNKRKQYNIIYLYEQSDSIEKHIIGFSLIDISNLKSNIISLSLLCSSNIKTYIINEKKIGLFLLDYLYNYYKIYENPIALKLYPTQGLLEYYTNWKTPDININGELIYANTDILTNDTLNKIFESYIFTMKMIMKKLSIYLFPIEINTFKKQISYLQKLEYEYEYKYDNMITENETNSYYLQYLSNKEIRKLDII